MFSQVYYLVRSRADGRYLLAHPPTDDKSAESGYLLMFRENFEALSFLNTHGADVAERFAVESIPATKLKDLLKRWGYQGVGIVQDPLLPKIDFLSYE